MLGVFWCFGSKSTCPYCWGEGWGWWQHGENDVFVPFALLTGQKKAESPIRLPNWPIHPRCDVNMLVFLMVCFGAVPDIILSFLITKCGFITHGPVILFWSFPCFQPELPLRSEAFVIPCFTVKAVPPQYWTFAVSRHLCPQAPWPVGLQDLLLHEVTVWVLTVNGEYVFKYVPSFLFIHLLH